VFVVIQSQLPSTVRYLVRNKFGVVDSWPNLEHSPRGLLTIVVEHRVRASFLHTTFPYRVSQEWQMQQSNLDEFDDMLTNRQHRPTNEDSFGQGQLTVTTFRGVRSYFCRC
jgi:hypothetical protein